MTIRAIRCHQLGSFNKLTVDEIPEPVIQAKHVVVKVHCVAINYRDLLLVQGKYQEKPELPFIPGTDFAGVIEQIAGDVHGMTIGDRVMVVGSWGALAEKTLVKASQVLPIPDAIPSDVAATLPTAYGTALYALRQRGKLAADETLLVLGAGGGVGLAAVQLGRHMGANVIAVAGDSAKLEKAIADGAQSVINYTDTDLVTEVKRITAGRGCDVILDCVGGDAGSSAVRCVAWNGRILIIGFAAGTIPALPNNRLLLKGASAVGVNFGAHVVREVDVFRANLAEVFALVEQCKISPRIYKHYPLQDTASAMSELEDRQVVGKVVVTLNE